jgi:hypothetical protein
MPCTGAGWEAAARLAGTGRLVPEPPLRLLDAERLVAAPRLLAALDRAVAVLLRRVVVTAVERRGVVERLVAAGRALVAALAVVAAGLAAGVAGAPAAATEVVGVLGAAAGTAAGVPAAEAGLAPVGVLELAMGEAGGGERAEIASGEAWSQGRGLNHRAPRSR